MKPLNRRALLLLTFGLAGTGLFGGAILFRSEARAVLRIIRQEFGDAIADQPAASEFARAFADTHLKDSAVVSRAKHAVIATAPAAVLERMSADDGFRNWVVSDFVKSTTAVRAYEAGAALQFFGFYGPHEIPCMNPFSVHML